MNYQSSTTHFEYGPGAVVRKMLTASLETWSCYYCVKYESKQKRESMAL